MTGRKLDVRRRNTQFIADLKATLATISRHGLVERGLGVVTQTHTILYAEGRGGFRTYDAPNGVMVVSAFSHLPRHAANAARILGTPVRVVHADHFGTVYEEGTL